MQLFWGVECEETLQGAVGQVQLLTPSLRVGLACFFFSPGAESEESFKDFGKNREAMRLCREGEWVFLSPLFPYVGPKVCFDREGLHTELDSETFDTLRYCTNVYKE